MKHAPAVALCDAKLHDGLRVVADYMVWAAEPTTVMGDGYVRPRGQYTAFACCPDHVLHAITQVLASGASYAIVRSEMAS
jgi:hypothetical protein